MGGTKGVELIIIYDIIVLLLTLFIGVDSEGFHLIFVGIGLRGIMLLGVGEVAGGEAGVMI